MQNYRKHRLIFHNLKVLPEQNLYPNNESNSSSSIYVYLLPCFAKPVKDL